MLGKNKNGKNRLIFICCRSIMENKTEVNVIIYYSGFVFPSIISSFLAHYYMKSINQMSLMFSAFINTKITVMN